MLHEDSLSTPNAARKLLRLLACSVIVCLVFACSMFFAAVFNHEISQLRRQMNAAMYEAQAYINSRELLLEHISRDVTHSAYTVRADPIPRGFHDRQAHFVLGDSSSPMRLTLAVEDLQELEDRRMNLIYVAYAGEHLEAWRLVGPSAKAAAVPPGVMALLAQTGTEREELHVRWLSDPADLQSRQYLFSRVELEGNKGWLGAEIFAADISAAFNSTSAGHYLLLDQQHRIVLGSSVSASLVEALRQVWDHDNFAFVGAGWFPSHVALLKHLGSSSWSLIYYVDLPQLLLPLLPQLFICALLLIIGGLFVWWLYWRINQRVIEPAQQRLVALVENESFLRVMIQTLPMAVCVLRRRDASVVMENRLANTWLGGGEARKLWSLEWLERTFEQGDDGGFIEIKTASGMHLYLCYTAARYKDEEVLCCAFSDISARKHTEEALAEAKRLSDAANEAKTLFLATMSHEIRTPLYGVLGTLELLGRTALDHQQAGYLRAIERSSSTLLQLISDVLDVSKIEAGQLGLELTEFSPTELALNSVQAYAAAARAKGVQLYACCDAKLPERMIGDAVRIRQILNNLLSNAVKFTDNGRIVMRVWAEEGLKAEPIRLYWQVVDTGIGISREVQEHLFDPFYQVSGQARMAGGTGLGLSICKRLCDLMQGQLRVVSDTGLGSSFLLELPMQPVTQQPVERKLRATQVWVHTPVRELSESICGWINRWGARAQILSPEQTFDEDARAILMELRFSSAERKPFPSWKGLRVVVSDLGGDHPRQENNEWHIGRFNLLGIHEAIGRAQGLQGVSSNSVIDESREEALGLRVLVVEDNPINQLILRDQLVSLGCDVDMVSDGKRALRRWQEGVFDVVLTDVNMPNMSGYELASTLRQMGCNTPIIGASANAMNNESERCLEAGMDMFLLKPLELQTLRYSLSRLPNESTACVYTKS